MTVSGLIERTDALFPNVYPFPQKAHLLYLFDKKLWDEFLSLYRDCPEEVSGDKHSPDRELLLGEEYSDVYTNYLISQLELQSGNITGYSNRAALFNSAYLSFMNRYNRTHEIEGAKITID